MRDGEERNRTYDWARRHGLCDPYNFALHYSRLWGDPAELAEVARLW